MGTLTIEQIARISYEATKEYEKSIGEITMEWEDIGDILQKSRINAVKYRINNPIDDDELKHYRWVAKKAYEGWTFGNIEDKINKKHPCICLYEELEPYKDPKAYAMFCAIVDALKN